MPNKYDGPSMDYGKGMPMGHESDGPGMHHESAKQERKELLEKKKETRRQKCTVWVKRNKNKNN